MLILGNVENKFPFSKTRRRFRMATKSDLFYDPFAERSEKPEGLDYKFSRDREPKNGNGNGNGIGSSGSANEEDSHHDDDQVSSFPESLRMLHFCQSFCFVRCLVLVSFL